MDSKIIFRDYIPDDYKLVNDLWQEIGLGGDERGDDDKKIEDTLKLGGKLIIIEDTFTKKIIGTSWITFDGRRMHMHHFGIKPEYQNKGYGEKLVRESLKFAKEKRCQIKLEVHQSNTSAIKLYKKTGFKYLGDYNTYIIRDIENI